MRGFVLSGGGARGAYEAGVLRYVLDDLPRRFGFPTAPHVITGTSIGAITGAWVGATGAQGIRTLSHIWQTLTVDRVYTLNARDLLRVPELMFGYGPRAGLLDPSPLREFVEQALPWDAFRARIDSGGLRAFVCAATDVASGYCTLWVDGQPLGQSHPTTVVRATHVGPEHVLASAAIPLIFPPVSAEGRWYADGALRQNTPLSPAVALGVTRALVVGVKKNRVPEAGTTDAPAPTPGFLAGKALNALMLDPVEEDLRRLRSMNELLAWGSRAYPDFESRLRAEHRPYRQVRVVHVCPSEDLGRMAAVLYRDADERLPWATRMLLRTIGAQESDGEADLLSYLLFDHAFTGALERLGWEDARRREDELVELFQPEPAP